ncbi:MAG: hypothetical protein IJC92_02320, partial [Bacteroidaceae bacterium]|nr:hypothetical protein [Bacteroidaceae bacterium]
YKDASHTLGMTRVCIGQKNRTGVYPISSTASGPPPLLKRRTYRCIPTGKHALLFPRGQRGATALLATTKHLCFQRSPAGPSPQGVRRL